MTKDIQFLDKPFRDSDIAGYTTAGWYFWDETQAFCHGPYDSAEEAQTALNKYASDFLSSL